MSSVVKSEFFRWIGAFDPLKLSDIDIKLLNLFVDHFDTLEPLTTLKGVKNRAVKLNELIQAYDASISSVIPDVIYQPTHIETFDRITEFEIGPFRGFETKTLFKFDKKYCFLFGPNGSGKSSFCEGLEYALMGGIEEAGAKKIGLDYYIKNTQLNKSDKPVAYGKKTTNSKVAIPENPRLYRFSFVEKNRIDGFARIASTAPGVQKDRIATLFGLDAFSSFVDGFTDDIDKYIPISTTKAEALQSETDKNLKDKSRLLEIEEELKENSTKLDELVDLVERDDVKNEDELLIFLSGVDGISGFIQELQTQKGEVIPIDFTLEAFESLPAMLSDIRITLDLLDKDLKSMTSLSSVVNFKDLFSAISSIGSAPDSNLLQCPACHTPITSVLVNPFENAKNELEKLESLSVLQDRILVTAETLSSEVRTTICVIKTINELGINTGFLGSPLPLLTEFIFSKIDIVNDCKSILGAELLILENLVPELNDIKKSVENYNLALSAKRNQQLTVDVELKKYNDFKTSLIELMTIVKTLTEEKNKCQKAIDEFTTVNAEILLEIAEENTKNDINKKYIASYKKLIDDLKRKRDQLPSQYSAGLSEKVKEYYNMINAHDPDFELLDSLTIPLVAGAKIEIKFKKDTQTHDALNILSEGHLKIMGLSILLAKAVHENLGFLIFDDIVNAIDDAHRDGVAELLLLHDDLKDRQHILTCHGDSFISKLEHKLGSSDADKHVNNYRFVPADSVIMRGVKIHSGDSKHNLIKANEYFSKNDLKSSAASCRGAIEILSNHLWKKLGKQLNINLQVTMRAPGGKPDLAGVVDSLIKELEKIDKEGVLLSNLKKLKAKYPWSLLNEGAHENDDRQEFERNDIFELIKLVTIIEESISVFRLSVSCADNRANS